MYNKYIVTAAVPTRWHTGLDGNIGTYRAAIEECHAYLC